MGTRGRAPLLALLLLLTPARGHAQGFNLSWDECGVAGYESKTFACNTGAGAPFQLIGSFVTALPVTEFTGVLAQVGFENEYPDAQYFAWWRFGASSCRSSVALEVDVPASGPTSNCAPAFVVAPSTTHSFQTGPSRFGYGACLTLRVGVAPDQSTALEPGTEYYAFRISIPRTGTTGCASSCATPVCIGIHSLVLERAEGEDVYVTTPADRGHARWQGAQTFCPPVETPSDWSPGTCADVPTSPRRSTWGTIRSLYR